MEQREEEGESEGNSGMDNRVIAWWKTFLKHYLPVKKNIEVAGPVCNVKHI